MGEQTRQAGVAYIHAGTHKTGTSSVQTMLARNGALLEASGVYVPVIGRPDRGSAGHHNIAWELGRNPQFNPASGTLAELCTEIATCGKPTVCLSSEEFEFLSNDPEALARLRDGFTAAGYQTRIILYLRPQADYLESLYAEAVKAWDIEFDDFLETIVATGGYTYEWPLFDTRKRAFGGVFDGADEPVSQLAYDELCDGFAAVFGRANVIVRAYKASVSSGKLLREFLDIIAPDAVAFKKLRLPDRVNRSFGFCEVVTERSKRLGVTVDHHMRAGQRFDALSLLDLIRITARFARGNERIAKTYGVHIGTATRRTLLRELAVTFTRDRASRYRKQLVRALRSRAREIAA